MGKIFISIVVAFCLVGCFLAGHKAEGSSSVLVIGDSHTEATFGGTLDRGLRDSVTSHVATFGVGGSIPDWWLDGHVTPWGYFEKLWNGVEKRKEKVPTPLFSNLLEKFNPGIVVIALGTNYIWYWDVTNPPIDGLRKLVAGTKGRRCFWIGPPALGVKFFEKGKRVSETINSELSRQDSNCTFIDSMAVTAYPAGQGDGIHYDLAGLEGKASAINWANHAVSEIIRLIQ